MQDPPLDETGWKGDEEKPRWVRVEEIASVGTKRLEDRLNEIVEHGEIAITAIRVLVRQTNDPAITVYTIIYPDIHLGGADELPVHSEG